MFRQVEKYSTATFLGAYYGLRMAFNGKNGGDALAFGQERFQLCKDGPYDEVRENLARNAHLDETAIKASEAIYARTKPIADAIKGLLPTKTQPDDNNTPPEVS